MSFSLGKFKLFSIGLSMEHHHYNLFESKTRQGQNARKTRQETKEQNTTLNRVTTIKKRTEVHTISIVYFPRTYSFQLSFESSPLAIIEFGSNLPF